MDTMEHLLTTPSSDGNLRAELWADAMVNILSRWIPLALAGIVVGGNILGSSIRCFPLYLASAVTPNTDNVNGSSAEAIRDPRLYSSQLDEFVNAYCGKQATFDYRVFVIMLVMQSAFTFAPQLVWSITTAREVICNLNFIKQYIEALYQTKEPDVIKKLFRKTAPYQPKLSEQKRLVKFVKNLRGSKKIYHRYMAKQGATAFLVTIFFMIFWCVRSAAVYSIQDNFNCTVSQDFTVDCSVTSASLYRFAWGVNMVLLILTEATFVVHLLFYIHCLIDEEPFKDVGINVSTEDPELQSLHGVDLRSDVEAQSPPTRLEIKKVTDCHLMYTFLKANIDVIEKYNYTAILHKTKGEQFHVTEEKPVLPNSAEIKKRRRTSF